MTQEISMNKILLLKLNDILEKNLENEHFGVKELAREIGLSRSQLHRKLHALTRKSTSQYIREYRLEKAMEMLQNNVATASEIAYRVGFNSPTYFNTCFREYFGYTPGEVKYRNKFDINEIQNIRSIEQSDINQQTLNGKLNQRMLLKQNSFVLIVIGLLLIIASSYYFYFNSSTPAEKVNTVTETLDKSIAVLPFENLSDDKESQYFTDGIMGSIHNHLSGIADLKVISEISMEKYRKTTKSAPEIAEELDVSYLLDGSVQKINDSIRVIVHLINANSNQQLTSMIFDWEFNNILAIQSSIAKQIAKELHITLSPMELAQIENKPTENLEAYTLYLKGRFFWHQRSKKDLNKSIYYFNKAIALDSMYALAYAGLADAYYFMSNWKLNPKDDGFVKAKAYAEKALSINNNIAEAHATLGKLYAFRDWKWEAAEKELKMAISLDPNSATAHQYYYELLEVIDSSNKDREEINMAIKLNPYDSAIRNLSTGCYFRNSKFFNAIEEASTGLELANEPVLIFHLRLKIILSYLNLNEASKAVENIKLLISTDQSIENYDFLDEVHEEYGINGVLQWLIDWMLVNKQGAYNRNIAKIYALIGDAQNTLNYLEKGYENRELGLHFIKGYPNFDFVKKNPRFIALLEKMNLAD